MKHPFKLHRRWGMMGAIALILSSWTLSSGSVLPASSQTVPTPPIAPTAPSQPSSPASINRLTPSVTPTPEQQRQLERLRLERLERERLQFSLDQLQLRNQLGQQDRELQRQLQQQQQLQRELQQQRQQLEWQQDQRAFELRNQQVFDRTFDRLNSSPLWNPPSRF